METQFLEDAATLKEEWKTRQDPQEWPTTEMEDINHPISDSLEDHSESTTTTTDKSEILATPSQQMEESLQQLPHEVKQVVADLQTQESAVYSMECEAVEEEEKPVKPETQVEQQPEEVTACNEPKEVEQVLKVKEEPMEPMEMAHEEKITNGGEEEERKLKEEQQDGSSKLVVSSSNDNSATNNNNNNSSGLGRNRRVRQKNRYFQDFHCIDLTKGNRNSRDDYDAFTTATPTASTTRSSNRRSTTDSASRPKDDDTAEVLESKYCRKCSSKTAHDIDGGCQACLYKKIVESSKKQRSNGQKGTRGSGSSKPCTKSPPQLDSWSPDEVANYILSKGFAQEAEFFKSQSVDGISLLLMQRNDFTYGLKIKLGPALKIYDQVCKLKKEYFQSITIPQQ